MIFAIIAGVVVTAGGGAFVGYKYGAKAVAKVGAVEAAVKQAGSDIKKA
jgi:hypothetical protein